MKAATKTAQELAAAVVAALEIPQPDRYRDPAYLDLLESRLAYMRGVMHTLATGDSPDLDVIVRSTIVTLNKIADKYPVTYPVYQPATEAAS